MTATGRRHGGVLPLACLILFVDGYDLFTLGTVGPSLVHYQPWGATTSAIGLLGSATALGMPLGSMLAGWSADRWGRRTPMIVAVVWISASMLAATFAPGLGFLVAVRFCTGIGIGALAPLVSAYVADHAPPRRAAEHCTSRSRWYPSVSEVSPRRCSAGCSCPTCTSSGCSSPE